MSLKKKLLCLILCTVIVSSLSITVWAETITQNGGMTRNTITAYSDISDGGTIYSVDINWGSLEFVYQNKVGTWNPATHTYDDAVEGWKPVNVDGDKITITNHSNVPINTDISAITSSLEGLSILKPNGTSLNQVTESLLSAVGTEPANAPSVTVTVVPSGEFEGGTKDALVEVGTITITITPQ